MENRIWYEIKNTVSVEHLPGVVCISPETFCSYKHTVQASIDAFNSHIEWKDMWTIEDAEKRIKEGHVLFIGTDKEGPLAHVWFDSWLLYNMYVDPRRPDGYGVKFAKFCLQFNPADTVKLYCDDWNIRAQKFFEKVGSIKI